MIMEMTPMQLAAHVIIGELHNDVEVIGPLGPRENASVRIYLRNGYGIAVSTGRYVGERLIVAPIRRTGGMAGFAFAWEQHPDFTGRKSEPNCDPERAAAILTHLKGATV